MSVILKQVSGSQVQPVDDARLYDLILSGQVGIVEGCEITHLGANQLQVSSGWGVCRGRVFVIEEETINANVSAGDIIPGRLMLHIDIASDIPALLETQSAAVLPELIQEDINGSGTIYEVELARYNVSQIMITDLEQTFIKIKGLAKKTELLTVIFSASGWSNTAPYTQTVFADGISEEDNPVSDVKLSTDTQTAIEEIEAWGCVSDITTAEGSVIARCLEEKPAVDLVVSLLISR